jgi:hypothetical protein
MERCRGAPCFGGLGFGLELREFGHLRERVDVGPHVPVRMISEAYPPLWVTRWRWSGRPAVVNHLDGDGVVDEHDLDQGLGRAVARLGDGGAGPPRRGCAEGRRAPVPGLRRQQRRSRKTTRSRGRPRGPRSAPN